MGGYTEVITENITGFIAEAPTVSSFRKALDKAWENKNEWENMGKAAHEFCLKNVNFTPEKVLLENITV